jgi:hypothetical protein
VFRPVLFHAKLGDALDQAVRERLIEWKTKIALLSRIPRYGFLESRISSDRWVEADVLREGCKINEHAVQLERRDPVADRFLGAGSGAAHSLPNPLEDCLYFRRESRNILVDRFRRNMASRHIVAFPALNGVAS